MNTTKMVLVMNAPKDCARCPLSDWIDITYDDESMRCNLIGDEVFEYKANVRPDICPLVEMPKKRKTSRQEGWKDVMFKAYDKGYNACINDILATQRKKKKENS